MLLAWFRTCSSENHKVRFSIECSSINISFAATADGKIKSLEVYGKTYPDCLMYSDKTYRLLPVLFTQEPNKDTGATSYFKILNEVDYFKDVGLIGSLSKNRSSLPFLQDLLNYIRPEIFPDFSDRAIASAIINVGDKIIEVFSASINGNFKKSRHRVSDQQADTEKTKVVDMIIAHKDFELFKSSYLISKSR